METLLYCVVRAGIGLVQSLPLTPVGLLGRWVGVLAYFLDARHRQVVLRNLTLCFGQEKSRAEIRSIARENFRRIGENFICAMKTAAMSFAELGTRIEFIGPRELMSVPHGCRPKSVIAAIGHFGNFELYARFGQFAPAYKCATTYRGLPQPWLNRLLQSLRERSGCLFFDRRSDAAALRALLNEPGIMLGLLCDQHTSSGGLWLPFLGHDCFTSPAPALLALRYGCGLHTGICYRVGLARWRIELSEEIPTRENGQPRSSGAIMGEVNQAFEKAVRRDPANWFWVHKRWKPRQVKTSKTESGTAAEKANGEGTISTKVDAGR